MNKVLSFDLSSGESGIDTAISAAVKFLNENPDWRIKGFAVEDKKSTHPRLEIIKCEDLIESEKGNSHFNT